MDWMIPDIVNVSLDTDFIDSLTKTSKDFNLSVNSTVLTTMQSCTFGIGASLLGIFMLMELVSIIQRSDGSQGLTGLRIPANILIKWGIVTFLFCNLRVVLDGIQAVVVYMTSSPSFQSTSTDYSFGNANAIISTIESLNFFTKIWVYLIVFIEWLAFRLLRSLISALVVMRMFQLWLMMMFAPIPLSTLPSNEFRQTAINFIKSFAAVCLSGAVILGTFKIFGILSGSLLSNLESATDLTSYTVFINLMLKNMVYMFVLFTVTLKSSSFAKQLLNAM